MAVTITVNCPQHGGEFRSGCVPCATAAGVNAMNGSLFGGGERLEVVREGPA